jgi:hypothetical protein
VLTDDSRLSPTQARVEPFMLAPVPQVEGQSPH